MIVEIASAETQRRDTIAHIQCELLTPMQLIPAADEAGQHNVVDVAPAVHHAIGGYPTAASARQCFPLSQALLRLNNVHAMPSLIQSLIAKPTV